MDLVQEHFSRIMTGEIPIQRRIAKEGIKEWPEQDIVKTIEINITHKQWEIRNFIGILLAEMGGGRSNKDRKVLNYSSC